MTKLLIRLFIRQPDDIHRAEIRTAYGNLASFTGAAVNVLLFALKFTLGFFSGSIAITADAFNNLSDVGSNAVTFFGFKLAAQPPDKEHPFGHGRFEYLSGLLIALFVLMVGVEIIKSAVEKIIHPQAIVFSWFLLAALLLSIAVKLWLGLFYRHIGGKIDATSLLAAAADSKSDCISTGATLLGLLIFQLFGVNLDGWFGLAVGLLIIWAGIGILRETIAPLLGAPPDEKLVREIEAVMQAYEICIGVHDMIIHDYGPGRMMGSAHMEVPASCDILEAHDQIDNAEREIAHKFQMPFVIHMDPVETESEEVLRLKTVVEQTLEGLDAGLSFHDFRIVKGETHTNLIFDVVPPYDCSLSNQEIRSALDAAVHQLEPPTFCVVQFDRNYIG